jgi:hypothetical protein
MHSAPPDDGQYDRASALLAAHAEIAEKLAGLPVNCARAGHLRRQLTDLNATIKRQFGQWN